MKIEADTLEEAYSKAAKELSCSVTELDLQVLQYPKSGFLGFGKKGAIVEVKRKGNFNAKKFEKNFNNKNNFQNVQHVKKHTEKNERHERREPPKAHFQEKKEQKREFNTVLNEPKEVQKIKKHIDVSTAFDDKFHKEKTDPNSVIYEVSEKIKLLFSNLCFEISSINVSVYDDETLLVEIDGPDAALLIGKEGCRYKALSYLFYSWINIKYSLGIRLEIAEFLKNQEEMIGRYLEPIIERIHIQGRGQTKILDGVLIKIALERLRGEFPEKYVGIKSGKDGGRFIVVNDFNRKNS
ncbi:MAG: Jag N-terminal domain-containing protein [Campylobacteraceae bacterium]|jgi:spoIIIJ-associated protein|nr:Jag N-terminal domain-containing protein [Campylobacteraceae bacterium]